MRPRRVLMTQVNPAARMLGQDTESPPHAASPSERAENLEDELLPVDKIGGEAECLEDFNFGGTGRRRLAPHRISRVGRDRSGVIPIDVGEIRSPNLKVVRRAVQAETVVECAGDLHRQGIPRESCGAPSIDNGGNDSNEDEYNLGVVSEWCSTLSTVAAKKVVPPLARRIAPAFTATSHNYLASAEVARLGLVLEKGVGRVKAINSDAQPIAGVAKSVLIKVGPYEGNQLSVVVMDDFKLILGLEFLRDTRTTILQHVDSLMMMGAKWCITPTLAWRTREKNLSAM
ncbi:UNVERIFIED_CONTAM: hypothetical protein Sindi_2893300 [Sesamum indicum]